MAVFTRVSDAEVQELLRSFDPAAQLLSLEGISAGIENTNYFVTARLGAGEHDFVLTLFETLSAPQVLEYARIMQWWAEHGFPVPAPFQGRLSSPQQDLAGKPCLLIPRLPGSHIMNPGPEHCKSLGQLLARMHQIAQAAPFEKSVERTLPWMRHQQQRLQGRLPHASESRLAQEINHYEANLPLLNVCETGLVHGDLFRDNLLFERDSISGLIDFYHSGRDVLLFDLAVVAIDWCANADGRLNKEKLRGLLEGYQGVRSWSGAETNAWPHLLRLAVLRFWLARLVSRYLPGYQQSSIGGDTTKDPAEMEQLLYHLSEQAAP